MASEDEMIYGLKLILIVQTFQDRPMCFWDGYPEVVTDEIFKYLSFQDVINLSSVSSSWYRYFGESKICMDKLQLLVEGWFDLEIFDQVLSKSPRRYIAIRMDKVNASKEIEFLKTQSWKSVEVANMKFESSRTFYEYLQQFGDKIMKLEINRILFAKDQVVCEQQVALPDLRILKLIQVPTSAFQPFERYQRLKSLRFDIPAIRGRPMDITNFFQLNFGIPLKYLEIRRNSLHNLPSNVLDMVEQVIMSFQDSLKQLIMPDWGNYRTIDRIWNSLSNMERCDIGSFINLPSKNLQALSANNNMKHLDITVMNAAPIKWIARILDATPNLEHLCVSNLRKEIICYAAHHQRKLKVLSYQNCVIAVGHQNLESGSTEVAKDPGAKYRFLGSDEIFFFDDGDDFPQATTLYYDKNLNVSFAKNYYEEMKIREEDINFSIQITKS